MSFTANPRAPKPDPNNIPQEPTGPVASDSLAAESLKSQGAFSENSSAAPLGVRGDQSTLNNTDTSGATTLPPAETGTEREVRNALGAGPDEKGAAGLKYPDAVGKPQFDGAHSEQGFVGGPSNASQQGGSSTGRPAGDSDFGASTTSSSAGGIDSSQIRSGSDVNTNNITSSSKGSSGSGGPAAGTGVRPHVDAAPTYASTVTRDALPENTFKPKGANLDDADVSQSIPQTKTFTGAIGTVNDPGRLAEREFLGRNEDPIAELGQAGEEGGRVRQKGQESQAGDQGQYGVLQSERA
ncbi:uncharacterized protein Z520_06729 [Fonsecaea multimorphosa CBS 102226]|uniref:Uncharacterized protein n=1 Tax=Fonsecaea multimorphosa CBS 102226 TaxID=1442371 RepID=A0A0D2JUX2_9EURO|nr:uncharacterized protein Z520_06729 [Fonsecaea multimorphosa CBS 102226]KIX97277.1 hypothetical protein Z520_06729 [Fonsecaea multimorphosa CBS 102226]OAL23245.1 hypothetical protein AYO22_06295 [Fonsecaea multimorphosa]